MRDLPHPTCAESSGTAILAASYSRSESISGNDCSFGCRAGPTACLLWFLPARPSTTPSIIRTTMLRTIGRKGVSPISVPIVLVVCFVTAVALGVYSLVFLRALLVNDRGVDLARTAAKGAHTLDRLLFERYEDIRVFATDRMLLDGRQEEKRNRLQQYKDLYGYYSWIGTTDAVGQVTAATDSPASQTNTIPADVGSRRLRSVETVRRTRRVHLEVVGGPAENGDATAVEFFAPLEDAQREFRGVVISAMPIEHFRAVLDEEDAQAEVDAIDWILVDGHGGILLEKHR